MYNKALIIARETMLAVKEGQYKTSSGKTINIKGLVDYAVSRSKLYSPDTEMPRTTYIKNSSPNITVSRETTLEAAYRFAGDNVCVLNFASAHHPGGAFLEGAIAQEESIARASALYHTLVQHEEYYKENQVADSLYLDYAIYSPDVPIIKNDRGEWLEEPYLISVVTSPAPNYSRCSEELLEDLEETFRYRIRQVLDIMVVEGHRNIILGAWGCGAFGNDPAMVSWMFKEALVEYPCFDNIVFAIYDSPDSERVLAFKSDFDPDFAVDSNTWLNGSK